MSSSRGQFSHGPSRQGRSGQRPADPPANRTWLCKPCNLLFSTWEGLLKHKDGMRQDGKLQHFHCGICGEDFKTEIAEIKHIRQNHAKAQELDCPGCGKGPFVRLAGLMSHIENDCHRINASTLEEMRANKSAFSQKLEALTKETVKSNYASYMPSTINGSEGGVSLGSQKPNPFMLKKNEFPGLPGQTDRNGGAFVKDHLTSLSENEHPGAWGKQKQLFENAPAARRPTQDQLQAATAPTARSIYDNMDPADPDHPSFNAASCYCKYAEKFLCPKVGCLKVFKTSGGLVGHLRSPAHSGTEYRCPYCLDTFNSLTAITAHAESQGTRCRIRDTENFDIYLDQLTAGIVDVAIGKNEDGTLKYHTTKTAREMFGGKQNKGKDKEPEDSWW
ncbi:Fc.00g047790.m01.CDS01 [Cosmosporella sp. VM-42]